MTCERARERLWPPERPRVAEGETLKAHRHVESCPACQEFFAVDRWLGERLRSIPLPPAPPSLRERVFEALAAERVRARLTAAGTPSRSSGSGARHAGGPEVLRRPAMARGLAAAAVAAALLLGGWFLVSQSGVPTGGPGSGSPSGDIASPGPQDPGSMEDFVHRASQEERVVSSDPVRLTDFMFRRLGIVVEPPSFVGFQLVGAEVCVVEAKRGAVLFYEKDGQVLYHYVVAHDEVTRKEPALSDVVPLRWSGSTAPSVVIWSDGTADQALVGNLSPDALLALARGEDSLR